MTQRISEHGPCQHHFQHSCLGVGGCLLLTLLSKTVYGLISNAVRATASFKLASLGQDSSVPLSCSSAAHVRLLDLVPGKCMGWTGSTILVVEESKKIMLSKSDKIMPRA
jgi:hypothetical protein